MSRYQQNFRKNPPPRENLPASKRPRISSPPRKAQTKAEEEDDPFADDDITGEELEEWEFLASQAEIKLTQEQSKEPPKPVNGYHSNGNGSSSFKIPAAKTSHVSINNNHTNYNKDLVKELQAKLAVHEKEVKGLEQSFKRKDGETLILRDRLSRAERDLTQEKVKVGEMQKRFDDAELERDKRIHKELEKYKDQVQFKQAEIMESQNLIKNLEAKNKMLEKQKPGGTSGAMLNNRNGFHGPATAWTNTQSDSGNSAPKKIRLVKPESPRVQGSNVLNKPSFSDDPLGRKRPTKYSPSKPSTSTSSPSPIKCETTKSEKTQKDDKIWSKFKLKSKYLSNDANGQMVLGNLLSQRTRSSQLNSDKFPADSPLLHLLNSKQEKRNNRGSAGPMESLQKLLTASQDKGKVFGYLCCTKHCEINTPTSEEEYEILSLIDDLLNSYVNLQDSLNGNRIVTPDTSSFHTAPSEQPATASSLPSCKSRQTAADLSSSICRDTFAAVQVLYTLTLNSQKITNTVMNQSSSTVANLLKMCDSERWNSRLELCQNITTTSLNIINVIAKSSKTELHMNRFNTIMRTEVLVPLVTHQNIDIKLNSMDVITTLCFHQTFALSIIKEEKQTGVSSLLCHICDMSCAQQPQCISEDDWLTLLSKVMTLLSILIAEHESLLVEHSCYSEIYRAADVLLYNELVLWKNDITSKLKRVQLIQRALCLLHSCANVYTDGIPGSRRDHRHQVVLTNLEGFLTKHGDQSSFWSQELNRIVKSEVGAIFEEVEIT